MKRGFYCMMAIWWRGRKPGPQHAHFENHMGNQPFFGGNLPNHCPSSPIQHETTTPHSTKPPQRPAPCWVQLPLRQARRGRASRAALRLWQRCFGLGNMETNGIWEIPMDLWIFLCPDISKYGIIAWSIERFFWENLKTGNQSDIFPWNSWGGCPVFQLSLQPIHWFIFIDLSQITENSSL